MTIVKAAGDRGLGTGIVRLAQQASAQEVATTGEAIAFENELAAAVVEAAGAFGGRNLGADGLTELSSNTHDAEGRHVPDDRGNLAVSKHGQGRIAGVWA